MYLQSIDKQSFGNRVAVTERKPWIVYGDQQQLTVPTLQQAFDSLDMNYGVEKYPMGYLKDGSWHPIETKKGNPKWYALVREATEDSPEKVFAKVTQRYTPYQNTTFAKTFDVFSSELRLEGVFALGEGKHTGALWQLGDFTIDANSQEFQHNAYVMVMESKTGLKGLSIALVHLRLHCTNAFTFALKKAELSFNLHHSEGIDRRAEWATGIITHVVEYRNQEQAILQKAANHLIGNQDFEDFAEEMFPMPKKATASGMKLRMNDDADYAEYINEEMNKISNIQEKVEEDRALLREFYVNDPANGTAYGLIQSATAFASHTKGKNTGVLVSGTSRYKLAKAAHDYVAERV